MMLIRTYRVRGHLAADLDPLRLTRRDVPADLTAEYHGFYDDDLDRPIWLCGALGFEQASVREIVSILQRNYCGHVGLEYMHINEVEERRFLQERMEGKDAEITFTPEGKQSILAKVIHAEQWEKFLARKYVGTKRFGLDGGESAVPALEAVIKYGGQMGVTEIDVGMAHRGRLNILSNVMGKPAQAIFHEFAGGATNPADVGGSGDVKYHLGTSSDREFDGNKVHLSLLPNPSHLEAVDPVVLGKARAVQTIRDDKRGRTVLPILLHGDAAFAAQGVVWECLSFSGLPGYGTGGTIHFIINNQIGFTTSPQFGRSSPYPSDVAKGIQAPILHVNGDDPEAVTFCCKLATEFRQTFSRDVVIDMWCYRRFGHNEGDEPSFTQPLMYAAIKQHPPISEIYGKRLIDEGVVDQAWIDATTKDLCRAPGGTVPGRDLLFAEQGRLVRGPLGRSRPSRRAGARPPQHPDRDQRRRAEAPRRGADDRSAGFRHPQDAAARARREEADVRDRRRASTGRPARRSPSAACSQKAMACACPARTAAAARSASATPFGSTSRPARNTSR